VATISELWRYPVKSMQGERIDVAEVGEGGIPGDRAYALVDRETGHVVSAKHPRKWASILDFSARLLDDGVEITTPGGDALHSAQPDIDASLSAAIGRDVNLVASAPSGSHYEMFYPDIDGVVPADFLAANRSGDEAGGTLTDLGLALAAPGTFFDVTPLHAITTATLAHTGDVRRFRPNVVIDEDGDAFAENAWVGATLVLGPTATAQVLLPAMRCVMTTLPQPGLAQDRGVLQGIARDNRVEIPGMGTWACAGVYATPASAGAVAVGDAFAVRF
jgi:uncharacterized protein YcbX